MIPDIDVLTVTIDGKRVGQLARSSDHRGLFEYDSDWLNEGYSISPFDLPLKAGLFTAKADPFDGLFGVFHDSLPGSWGNRIIDRWLREQGVNPNEVSWLERLAIVGCSGMGALCYEPEVKFTQQPMRHNEDKLLEYDVSQVGRIIKNEPVDSLDELIQKTGFLGGDHPKMLMDMEGQSWLIKFRSEEDPNDIGKLEYLYSITAKLAGIDMPETRLFEGTYFGTRRFDRQDGSRIHTITASGLLHVSHRHRSLDYTDLMKATFLLTRSMVEVKKVYRLMVFNVLTHNREDRPENFSFLYRDGTWICAPAYDLVYSHGFKGKHATKVLGSGTPDQASILRAGEEAGLSPRDCHAIFKEVEEATRKLAAMIHDRWSAS